LRNTIPQWLMRLRWLTTEMSGIATAASVAISTMDRWRCASTVGLAHHDRHRCGRGAQRR
jgi:hypothetical protein